MKKVQYIVDAPLYFDYYTFEDYQPCLANLIKLIEDLRNLETLNIEVDSNKKVFLNFEFIDDKRKMKSYKKLRQIIIPKKSFIDLNPSLILRINLTILFQPKFSNLTNEQNGLFGHMAEDMVFEEADDICSNLLDLLFLSFQITYPGSFIKKNLKIFRNKKLIILNIPFEGENFIFSLLKLKENRWPKTKRIKFIDTWSWINQFNDIKLGFSQTPVGNAVNALRYLAIDETTKANSEIENIMWLIIALESLYLHGSDIKKGKTKELRNRIISFLEKVPNKSIFKEKHLENYYNYRSRLLHGDINIPAPIYLEWKQEDKYLTEIFEVSQTLNGVLFVTLQQLIIKNWQGIKFKVKYIPEKL